MDVFEEFVRVLFRRLGGCMNIIYKFLETKHYRFPIWSEIYSEPGSRPNNKYL
jgi:hypothetical protein